MIGSDAGGRDAATPAVPDIPANLRINADDFGLSPAISRTIVESAEAGLINSTSVVPFRDDESAALLLRLLALPAFRIGAHLTYIEVPLLTRPASFPEGTPPGGHREFLAAFLKGRISVDDVRAEWRAQLDLLGQRLGGRAIHHLDGHQHLHLMPGMWAVTVDLARQYGAAVVRRPCEAGWRAWLKDFPLGAGLQALAWSRARGASERFFGVGTSMHFTAAAYAPLAREIPAHPERQYELMVHPGPDPRGQRELEELRRWLRLTAAPAR